MSESRDLEEKKKHFRRQSWYSTVFLHFGKYRLPNLSGKLAPKIPWGPAGFLSRCHRSILPPAAGRADAGRGSPPGGCPALRSGSGYLLRPSRPSLRHRSNPAARMTSGSDSRSISGRLSFCLRGINIQSAWCDREHWGNVVLIVSLVAVVQVESRNCCYCTKSLKDWTSTYLRCLYCALLLSLVKHLLFIHFHFHYRIHFDSTYKTFFCIEYIAALLPKQITVTILKSNLHINEISHNIQ